ncbi:MAG: YitT family protein [Clostridia bacterium]|nr:YitT family protein [Oscillospiraceae bacterium]MBQ6702824.1 YitT family protein [Clostridia bacterium]
MSNKTVRKILWDYLIITLGCVLYSISFTMFFDSNNLAMGGFTGLAQVLDHFIPAIPIGTAVFVMNVPLMIIGFKKEGFKLLFASFYAIFLTSVLIDGISYLYVFPPMDPLLACIFGSILLGISLGIMMLKSATTGGTELMARLIKYKIHSLSIGKVCLIIDVTVICIYALSFRMLESALYGIIAMYISSIAMDAVCYGSSNGKMAYIISEHNDGIMKDLLDLGFGVTVVNGKGGWTGDDKKILLCTVKKNKIAVIKSVVSKHDPERAFVIVCEAKEVFGEGFGDYSGIGL